MFGQNKKIREVLAQSTGFVNWLERHLTVSDRGINRALCAIATNSDLNIMAAHYLPVWIDKELLANICANFANMEESNIYQVLTRKFKDRS